MVPSSAGPMSAICPTEGRRPFKIARVVDIFAQRLQTQEALTARLRPRSGDAAAAGLRSSSGRAHVHGVRGVRKRGSTTMTTSLPGLKDNPAEQLRVTTMVHRPLAPSSNAMSEFPPRHAIRMRSRKAAALPRVSMRMG